MNLFLRSFSALVSTAKRSVGSTGNSNFFGYSPGISSNNKIVTAENSLKLSAFWCGVHNIANSIAILPKMVYEQSDNNINPLSEHPVSVLINRSPNRCMTAFKFWFSFAVSILVKGNGFARIIRSGNGQPLELVLIHPEDVTVLENGGELFYRVRGEKLLLYSDEMLHVPGFSFNGLVGKSVVQYAADNLSMTLGADAFALDAYENRAVSKGVIEVNTGLSPTAKKNLKDITEFNMATGGTDRVTVLDEGMKYKAISLSPAEMQFIEAKANGVEDIARWLNIPLHKLHTKGEGGYNFLVQMSIEYLSASVQPLAQPIKEEIERKLLFPQELTSGITTNFNYKKLLEVDPQSRAQYYKDMVYIKAMNPNEVRKEEQMNPYTGGDEFLQMANMLNEQQLKKQISDGN